MILLIISNLKNNDLEGIPSINLIISIYWMNMRIPKILGRMRSQARDPNLMIQILSEIYRIDGMCAQINEREFPIIFFFENDTNDFYAQKPQLEISRDARLPLPKALIKYRHSRRLIPSKDQTNNIRVSLQTNHKYSS